MMSRSRLRPVSARSGVVLALVAAAASCAPPAGPRPVPDAPLAPLSRADSAWVERTLRSLSLREKVGQMVMPWVPADFSAVDSPEFDRLRGWVRDEGVGGVILSV